MANTSDTSNSAWGGLIEMPQRQIMQVAILGLALGAVAWVLGFLIKHLIVIPLFCGDPSSSICVNSTTTSVDVAMIVVAVASLLVLVRLSIYRPLLIVLAALVSLWGIGSWVLGLHWFEALAWFIVLYALAYSAFAWLVRPRSFVPMIIIVVVAVVLLRWLPTL